MFPAFRRFPIIGLLSEPWSLFVSEPSESPLLYWLARTHRPFSGVARNELLYGLGFILAGVASLMGNTIAAPLDSSPP